MSGSYRAKYLPQLKGPAAWAEILQLRPNFGQCQGEVSADMVIIGAGFAGLTCAYRALELEPRLKIIILDALEIAHSSTGRNSGFMIDLPHVLTSNNYESAAQSHDASDRLTALNRQAIAYAKAMVEDFDIPRDYFDQAGKINGAASAYADAHNQNYAAMLAKKGEPFERLDAKAMQQITGSSHYRSGLYTPGTVMLQPAGYIRALTEGLARRAGIFEFSPVRRFCKEGGAWQVFTPQAKISAKQVVLANNGHLASFGIQERHLMQVFLFASMTQRLDKEALRALGGQARWGVTPSDPMGTTMRKIDCKLGGQRIITRTCALLKSDMAISDQAVARAGRVHARKFAQRFGQLKGVQQEYQWSGHLCLTMNDVSLVQEVEQGPFTAAVQNGLGTARGTLTGIAAAEMALGATSEIGDFFAGEDAPQRLPPEPWRGWGANAYMRYKEWRAKEE